MANNISKISSLKVGETHFNLGTDIDQTGQAATKLSPGKGAPDSSSKEKMKHIEKSTGDAKQLN